MRHLLSWEEAVRQLTDVPARLYGMRERGRVALGWHADSWCSTPNASATAPSALATTSRVGRAGSTPKARESST